MRKLSSLYVFANKLVNSYTIVAAAREVTSLAAATIVYELTNLFAKA